MIKALRFFWKEQPIALSAFVLAMALLLFFGGRFILGFIYFHDPAHRNQALEGWMTPRYVSLSYSVPPEIIREVMGFEEDGHMRVHLDQVAIRLGITLDELEARVWAAKKAYKAEKDADRAAKEAEREAERQKERDNRDQQRRKNEAEQAKRKAERKLNEAGKGKQ